MTKHEWVMALYLHYIKEGGGRADFNDRVMIYTWAQDVADSGRFFEEGYTSEDVYDMEMQEWADAMDGL